MPAATDNAALGEVKRATRFVQAWGATELPNGRTLAEQLAGGGVSFWDVAAPTLAAFELPKVLTAGLPDPWKRLRARLGRTRQAFRDRARRPGERDGCAAWPAGPTALLLGFSAYMYRDVLEPVAARLSGGQALTPVSIHDEGRFQSSAGLETLPGMTSVWRHWDGDVEARSRAYAAEYRARVDELRAMRVLPQIVSDADESLWPRTEETFRHLWYGYTPRLIPQLALTAHLLEKHQPRIVVSADGCDPRARIYYLLARRYGIPTLEVQFGMCGEDSYEWRFSLVDRVAVWGEAARRILRSHGLGEERLVLTGSPRHDALAAAPDSGAAQMRARLGVSSGSRAVLFASLYSLREYANFGDFAATLVAVKRAIFRAAAATPGVTLIVKPHPLEDVAETQALAAGHGKIVFADRTMDIRSLIPACDAFVTLGSTATTDALVASKPIIYPAFPGLIFWVDKYVGSGAVQVVANADELTAAFGAVGAGRGAEILAATAGPRERFLREWVFRPDGRAAARVAALAVETTGEPDHG